MYISGTPFLRAGDGKNIAYMINNSVEKKC
jgi:hypothetical protein